MDYDFVFISNVLHHLEENIIDIEYINDEFIKNWLKNIKIFCEYAIKIWKPKNKYNEKSYDGDFVSLSIWQYRFDENFGNINLFQLLCNLLDKRETFFSV